MKWEVNDKTNSSKFSEILKLACDYLHDNEFDTYTAQDLKLCCNEVLNNAIIHGNKNDPTKYIYMMIEIKDRSLEIIILDSGDGFDYYKWYRHEPSEWATNGRGIYLCRSIMDEFIIDCCQGTRVYMMKKRPRG